MDLGLDSPLAALPLLFWHVNEVGELYSVHLGGGRLRGNDSKMARIGKIPIETPSPTR